MHQPLWTTVLVMLAVIGLALIVLNIVDAVRRAQSTRAAASAEREEQKYYLELVDEAPKLGAELALQLGPLTHLQLERIYLLVARAVHVGPVTRETLISIVGVSRNENLFVEGTLDLEDDLLY